MTRSRSRPEAVMIELHKLDQVVQLNVDLYELPAETLLDVDWHICVAPEAYSLLLRHGGATLHILMARPCNITYKCNKTVLQPCYNCDVTV